MSCPYKYILGIPEQGFHSVRFMGFALYDTLATIGLAVFTAYITHTGFLTNLLVWFVAGEVLHYMFGTQTALLTALGIRACPDS
jgi:hypothetical protein